MLTYDDSYATRFFDKFIAALPKEFLKDVYKSKTRWTGRMTDILGAVIEDKEKPIFDNIELSFQKEYYRIDYIGWHDRKAEAFGLDRTNDTEMDMHLWDMKIAVEHENEQNKWYDEIVKLVHVSCPLKVIIGYTPCNSRKPGMLEEKRLKLATKLMKRTGAFNNTCNDEYLIILGNAGPGKYDDYGYRGYQYINGAFEEIELK